MAAVALVVWSFARVGWRQLNAQLAPKAGVEITVLHWSGEGGPEEDAIVNESLRQFQEANPGVRVRRINPGDSASFYTKLQTMMASGDPPDVFYVGNERIPSFGAMGLLEPLEPYLERDAATHDPRALHLEDFYPQVVDAFRWDGTQMGKGALLGIPKDFTTVGFYYNKDLFRKAGVPFPAPDWTWDDYISAARTIGALTDEHGEHYTGSEFVTWAAMVRAYLYTWGVDVKGASFDEITLEDPRAMEALERLRSWRHDEEHTLTSGRSKIATGAAVFSTGRVGMAGPFGRWVVPEYARITSFDWDFAPLPRGSQRANILLTVAWAISSQSKHKDESWKLVRWLTDVDAQRAQARLGLAIPSNRKAAESDAFVNPAVKPANDQGFLDAIQVARWVDWPVSPKFESRLALNMDEGLKTGSIPVKEAVERFKQQWKDIRTSPLGRTDFPRMPWGMVAVCAAAAVLLAGVVVAALRARTRLPAHALREERTGYVFASPWVLGFCIFMAFPIVMSLLLSMTRWNGMGTLDEAQWVGLRNYQQLLSADETFPVSVRVTLYYALIAVPGGQVLALLAALLMNQKVRGVPLFRAAWYLPTVLAGVGVAVLWRWVFDGDAGLMNEVLRPAINGVNHVLAALGSSAAIPGPPQWFGKDAAVFGAPAFAIMSMWMVGGGMMIYLAGLQNIPEELHEAAGVDGVGAVRRFVGITLPMLSPVILFNTLMAVIGSFQVFTQAFVMTGGEPGDLTRFYVLYLFDQGFQFYEMGYASAMAWLLLLVTLGVTLLILRTSARLVYYEALQK